VSQKTTRRDLEFLQEIAFPMEAVGGDRGRKAWRYTGSGNGNGSAFPLTFTYDEAAAIYRARRSLQPLAGTNLGEAADSAMQKIRCTLGEKALEFFGRLQSACVSPRKMGARLFMKGKSRTQLNSSIAPAQSIAVADRKRRTNVLLLQGGP